MNNIIYKWLLNNNERTTTTKPGEETMIIDLIVILSINGVLIEYGSLLNYCNKIANDNEHQPIHDGGSCGLNQCQFQILHNNIQSKLTPLFENNTTSTTTSATTTISYNNIKSKFDCLITIIAENNIRNLNNSSTTITTPMEKIKKQPHNRPNKKIKTTETNATTPAPTASSIIISNRNKIGRNQDIGYLFYKAWGNIIIRKEILYHLRLYNIHINKKFTIGTTELLKYKYKSYMHSLELTQLEIFNQFTLPSELEHFGFTIYSSVNDMFKLNDLQHLSTSLTSISLTGDFNQPLDSNWLSTSNIKHIEFGSEFQQSIKIGNLPKSLTSLIFHNFYNGIIEYDAIPNSVTTLDYRVDNENYRFRIPLSTTNLKYHDNYNKAMNIGDIPHNVTSIEFGVSFNIEIIPSSLPHSIRTLKFGRNYNHAIAEHTLPPNLTELVFGYSFDQDLISPTLIPLSVKSIVFHCQYNYPIREGLFLNHTNLQSLIFNGRFNEIQLNSLPTSLTKLEFHKNLKSIYQFKQVLPVSLKSLTCDSYNIDVGDIPDQLTSIEFTQSFQDDIQAGSFSSNLKSVSFNNPLYKSLNSKISTVLPSTLDSISINCNNIDFLNSFDSLYLVDKIKLLNNK